MSIQKLNSTLSQASLGDQRHVEQFYKIMDDRSFDRALKFKFLDVFSSHLNASYANQYDLKSRQPERRQAERLVLAGLSMTGMEKIMSSVSSGCWWTDKDVVAYFADSWLGTWAWTRLLLSEAFAEQLSRLNERFPQYRIMVSVRLNAPGFLCYLAGCAAQETATLPKLLGDTDGFLSCLTQEYMRPTPILKIPGLPTVGPSLALACFLFYKWSPWTKAIVDTAGGPSPMVDTITRRLDHLKIDAISGLVLVPSLQIIHSLSISVYGISKSTDIEKVVQCLIRLLRRLDSPGASTFRAESIKECIEIFAANLKHEDGLAWAYASLRSQILPLLLDVVNKKGVPSPITSNICDVFDKFVPVLVYRSVLRPVSKSLHEIKERGLDKALSKRYPDVAKAWERFSKVAELRLQLKRDCSSIVDFCDACNGCQKLDMQDIFQLCSGCHAVIYCSKDCQTKDWKNQHREQCKGKESPFSKSLSRRDTRFITVITHNDLVKSSQEVLAAKRQHIRENPHVDPVTQVISLDYMTVPPKISILAPEVSIHDEVLDLGVEEREAKWKERVKICKEAKGEAIAVNVNLPCCRYFATFVPSKGIYPELTPENILRAADPGAVAALIAMLSL